MPARSHVRARAARGKCSLTRSRGGFVWQLKKLTKDMFSIMYASRGVGLAAPQLGVNRRLMVFNPEGDPKRWVSEVRRLHSKPPPGRQPQPPCRSPPPPSFPSDLGARQVVLCNHLPASESPIHPVLMDWRAEWHRAGLRSKR